MSDLEQRYQSKIEGPVSFYGRSIAQKTETRYALYSGISITSFLYKNGGNTFQIREFLQSNRIGNPFTDLIPGQLVKVDRSNDFAKNPDFG